MSRDDGVVSVYDVAEAISDEFYSDWPTFSERPTEVTDWYPEARAAIKACGLEANE